jgi:hypothetical protein
MEETKATTAEIVHAPNPYDEAPQAITAMDLIQRAIDKGTTVEQLERLFDLKLRMDAEEAKRAFVKALNDFKADPPVIIKDNTVSYENKDKSVTTYDHATLHNVCKMVGTGLARHGLSHRWSVEQGEGLVRVTCVLTHDLGHSEKTTLAAGLDQSGGKNNIQALGSTVTYLERYTLLAAVGLASKNGDDDGHATESKWPKLPEYLEAIKMCFNLEVLQKTFKEAVAEAMKIKDTAAMLILATAKDARKAELLKEEPA